MRRTLALLISGSIVALGVTTLMLTGTLSDAIRPVDYTLRTVRDTGAINAVTAILFDYRALDTLGEATVIFAASSVLAFLAPRSSASMLSVRLSMLILYGIAFLLPFIMVFGFGTIVFGHVSPGGGFTGGVMLSSSVVIFAVVYSVGGQQSYVLPILVKKYVENAAMFVFVSLGFIGLFSGGAYLANALTGIPLGEPGSLLSGGLIPLLNIATGFKVGMGLALIIISLFAE
ncbi:MAG: sodium:proton antiporter [Spirochaetaceae bacterium]|nr:MAG: sodium:proton antiporter [Spirochaetaceae bacterium]